MGAYIPLDPILHQNFNPFSVQDRENVENMYFKETQVGKCLFNVNNGKAKNCVKSAQS